MYAKLSIQEKRKHLRVSRFYDVSIDYLMGVTEANMPLDELHLTDAAVAFVYCFKT